VACAWQPGASLAAHLRHPPRRVPLQPGPGDPGVAHVFAERAVHAAQRLHGRTHAFRCATTPPWCEAWCRLRVNPLGVKLSMLLNAFTDGGTPTRSGALLHPLGVLLPPKPSCFGTKTGRGKTWHACSFSFSHFLMQAASQRRWRRRRPRRDGRRVSRRRCPDHTPKKP
jgi:hypothetical protein